MDKDLEKEILKMVYVEDHFEKIKDGERPDFRLFHHPSSVPFGVEITELHITEADARLKKIDSYRDELIDEEKYRHKDDIDIFDVGEIEIFDSDDSLVTKQKAIIREAPSYEDYFNIINDTITTKNENVEAYKEGLNHVNLIIYDQANKLFSTKAENFFKNFYRPSVRDVLLNTGFREIFFITVIEDSRRVFFPLKMLLYTAEFYFFGEFLEKQENEIPIDDLNEQIQLFAELMRRRNLETYIQNTDDGVDEVIWGNYGITVEEDKKVLVNNYADQPLPSKKRTPSFKKNKSIINSDFVEAFNEHSNNYVFTSGLVLDVKNSLK